MSLAETTQRTALPPVPLTGEGPGLVLVRSAGCVGSAVARALHLAGCPVVLVQDRPIATLRWAMSYAQAVVQGEARLAGVAARCVSLAAAARHAHRAEDSLPLVLCCFDAAIAALAPAVVIDACIKGPEPVARLKGSAPCTIGIGPRFEAGVDVDHVVESKWGPGLGAVITKGFADRSPGAPEAIDGLAWARFAYAPRSGLLRAERPIGAAVARGDIVARVNGAPVPAPLTGVVRGIVPDGAAVSGGEKIVEIDPRRSGAQCRGVGKRARQIATTVVEIVSDCRDSMTAQPRGSAVARRH